MVDRIVFGGVEVALLGLGVCMIVWPARVAASSRDDDDRADRRPLTAGEIWSMRVLGVVLVLGGGYGLYANLTRMPGVVGAP